MITELIEQLGLKLAGVDLDKSTRDELIRVINMRYRPNQDNIRLAEACRFLEYLESVGIKTEKLTSCAVELKWIKRDGELNDKGMMEPPISEPYVVIKTEFCI